MIFTLIILTVGLLAIGLPVFMALLIPSFVTFDQFFPDQNMEILIQQMLGGVNTYSLLAIPFFIFAADIISKGQIGRKLVNFANSIVGYLPGGLAMTTVVTCMFFGAISGAGSAAVVAIGGIVYPMMVDKGYSRKFTIGLILASSSLAMLIPPGIGMILYSTINPSSSIREIFAGGMVVGILTGLFFLLYSFLYAIKNKIPREPFLGFKELMKSLKEAILPLGLPIIVLGGIYLGITTITEAAALAVAYAVIVEGMVYRSINLQGLYKVALKSGSLIAMLLVLIAAGQALSYIMTTAGLPQLISHLFNDYSFLVILLLINIVFIILGMFIDPNSAIIIMTPLIIPIAESIGLDPVHLGLIIIFNLSIGMISPPFGLNIFIAQGAFKMPYVKIIPGVVPFIIISIVILLIITYIPDTVMWMPNLLR